MNDYNSVFLPKTQYKDFDFDKKRINFIEQLTLIILVYVLTSFFIAVPFYLSNYQVTFLNSLFEAISGVTGTGFSIFDNINSVFNIQTCS